MDTDTHIGIEMCEPASIKYVGGATFTCLDLNNARMVAKRTYESAVELFAYLCKEHNLNPLADGVRNTLKVMGIHPLE